MIVGTAGHIDHGKTSLVKALTGVDTDRLKEEKARGISIELGYAYKPLPGGAILGFVDVPGHEKFVDHMVAGATGIDFVLLVIAADDGPMPQTLEHLDIVSLLGVRTGAVAMTKVDRVDATRRAECEREIRALLSGGPLADAPIFGVSSVTREGLDALQAHLQEAAAAQDARRPGAGFRLAVDRCFTLDGIGTVVTGTVFSGAVTVGDEVIVSPSGERTRVRSLHAQNRTATVGHAGQRCALALGGIAKEAIARGDWIVAPPLHLPTARIDVRLRLSAREAKAFRHWTAVHLHLGAAHALARVALLEGESLAPGSEALAQLVVGQPIGAWAGDAFIVRDASGARTLGGGVVVDPVGRERHRRAPERLDTLRRLEAPTPAARLHALLEASDTGIDLDQFRATQNVAGSELELGRDVIRIESGGRDIAIGAAPWQRLRDTFVERLARSHEERPEELGPDLGRVRRMAFPRHRSAVVDALAASLLEEGRVARSGPWWHLPTHSIRLTEREEQLARAILPRLDAEGVDPTWVRDHAKAVGAPEHEVRALMRRLGRRGDVFAVVKDLYFSRSAVERLALAAKALDDESGAVRAAEFRDRIGIGRKRAIQILEFFDRVGFTRRAHDEHRVRGDSLLRLGESP
ncbi:Selenocysteine-specific elongation factor [Usitatibacter rugosus]|uniref:Selenocysteine-specific elongation factor n=1 Tax=Usitatibacter rugosus TaxID=2732067 RepID=A0A6M4GQE8_9PROT|nr:selenocysteine-specific translation elongation factor [Usitatibacter rugosus]QJR09286.1 Selenocysteine-specific elongation factor [Usitatibacter rugosus]